MYHPSPPVYGRADSNLALQQLLQFKKHPGRIGQGVFLNYIRHYRFYAPGLSTTFRQLSFLLRNIS